MKVKTCSDCGREGLLWKARPPLCKFCAGKANGVTAKKKLRRVPVLASKVKLTDFIKQARLYYLEAIAANIKRSGGKCTCDECEAPISNVTGLNVCHIVGKGANTALYFDKRNHFILGKGFIGQCSCGVVFDERGGKSGMKIYPRYVQIRADLNREYYNK